MFPQKYCRGCRTARPLTYFHRNSRLKNGLEHQCKLCRATKDRLRRASKQLEQQFAKQKVCAACQQTKQAEQFHHNTLGLHGMHPYCKDCKREADAIRRARSKHTIQQSASSRAQIDDQGTDSAALSCSAWCGQRREFCQGPDVNKVCRGCITIHITIIM